MLAQWKKHPVPIMRHLILREMRLHGIEASSTPVVDPADDVSFHRTAWFAFSGQFCGMYVSLLGVIAVTVPSQPGRTVSSWRGAGPLQEEMSSVVGSLGHRVDVLSGSWMGVGGPQGFWCWGDLDRVAVWWFQQRDRRGRWCQRGFEDAPVSG